MEKEEQEEGIEGEEEMAGGKTNGVLVTARNTRCVCV